MSRFLLFGLTVLMMSVAAGCQTATGMYSPFGMLFGGCSSCAKQASSSSADSPSADHCPSCAARPSSFYPSPQGN